MMSTNDSKPTNESEDTMTENTTETVRALAELQSARQAAIGEFEPWDVTVQELQLMLKAGDKNWRFANLTTYRANLSRANLSDANLSDANLSDAKADFLSKCIVRPHELAGLRLALVEGRVDGSVYEGDCACFIGTLANVAQCGRYDLGITPDASSPVERLFMAIRPGHTPDNNAASKIVVGWLDELIAYSSAV